MKRALFLASLIPASALAQGTDMPGTLDPGGGAPARAPAASRPAPAAAPQPNVIVVGSDGKVTSQAPVAAESGYYVSGGAPVSDDTAGEIHSGSVPDVHVVRSGDTLWDLSFYYFNNPWEWPKVWSYNPQITNPHWIYPADLVRLLPRGQFETAARPLPDDTVARTADAGLPAPARRTSVGHKTVAFIEKEELDTSVTIVGSVDEKSLLGDGDSVYLSYPEGKRPQVGQRYSIFRPNTSVWSGGKEFGAYVRLLGVLEVVSVKQDKRARGVIVAANQEIERGAKVGPLVKTYSNVPATQPTVDAQAPIVGMLQKDDLIGDGEIVFLGLGKSSGVEVGNRMYVVRRGDAYPGNMSTQVGKDDRRFPARALGEIVVVEVGENVSVGLVTLSVQEMSVGDLVMMQKAQ